MKINRGLLLMLLIVAACQSHPGAKAETSAPLAIETQLRSDELWRDDPQRAGELLRALLGQDAPEACANIIVGRLAIPREGPSRRDPTGTNNERVVLHTFCASSGRRIGPLMIAALAEKRVAYLEPQKKDLYRAVLAASGGKQEELAAALDAFLVKSSFGERETSNLRFNLGRQMLPTQRPIVSAPQEISDVALRAELDSDDLWQNNGGQAVGLLALLLERDAALGFEILIKRFDGWSHRDTTGTTVTMGRTGEPYSVRQLVKSLEPEEKTALLEYLVAGDLANLTTLTQRLLLGDTLRESFATPEAFTEAVRGVVARQSEPPKAQLRLEQNLEMRRQERQREALLRAGGS